MTDPYGHKCRLARRIFSPEDFGEAFTPELQKQEERMRARVGNPQHD